MFDPSAPHIIILLIVVLLLFGARRLPGAAKSLGESMHIFKRSVQGLDDEPKDNQAQATFQQGTLPVQPQPQPLNPAQPPSSQAQQLADLQRQLNDLQRQNAAAGGDSASVGQQQPF
jgi:sec-independent protein translocase protein TatA